MKLFDEKKIYLTNKLNKIYIIKQYKLLIKNYYNKCKNVIGKWIDNYYTFFYAKKIYNV